MADRFKRRTRGVNQVNVSCEALESRQLLTANPVVSIGLLKAVATEANTSVPARFVVQRTGPTDSPLTVNYTIRNLSTAKIGVDFTGLTGVVTIRAGQSAAWIDARAVDNSIHDGTRTLSLRVDANGYDVDPAKTFATVFFTDNDPVTVRPVISVIATKADAGKTDPTNTGKATFRIFRVGPLTSPLVVNYTMAGSTAVSGTDFIAPSGQVTIPAGQDRVFVDVIPTGAAISSAKTIKMNLSASALWTIVPAQTSATATIAAAPSLQERPGWYNSAYNYRAPLSVAVGAYDRTNKIVTQSVNFTTLLSNAGGTGSLNTNSIRVVETNSAGTSVVNANVPFQFEQAGNYNAATNASGTLVFELTGSSTANSTRYYHVYFDTGTGFTAPTVSSEVTLTDNVTDAGSAAYRINTGSATYYYQKANGGLSSMLDTASNDWISFDPTVGSGSSGEYRGIANIHSGDGIFHPGFNNASTQVLSQGPLRISLQSDSNDGQWSIRWDFYNDHATATITKAPANYWFLYEGTPGGSISANDYTTQSDGTTQQINTAWNDTNGLGNANGAEWVYFGDSDVNKYLFMAHNTADNLEDSFRVMDGAMTVFGFGRVGGIGGGELMNTVPNSFTIGLADGGSNATTSGAHINDTYRPVTIAPSTGQARLV